MTAVVRAVALGWLLAACRRPAAAPRVAAMRRLATALLAVVALSNLLAEPAGGQGTAASGPPCGAINPAAISCGGSAGGGAAGGPGGGGGRVPDNAVWYAELTFDENGERCYGTGYAVIDGYDPGPGAWDGEEAWQAAVESWGDEFSPCPSSISPGGLARRFWERIDLPAPLLRVAPGWAIAGKRAYLEIGTDRGALAASGGQIGATAAGTRVTWRVPNPLGADIRIMADLQHEVDWGDGEVIWTDSAGRPWPGGPGEIVHAYTDAGAVTLVVRTHWRARWVAAGAGGTLRGLVTSSRLDLPVREVQPVRSR